jgi:hypothetical protein
MMKIDRREFIVAGTVGLTGMAGCGKGSAPGGPNAGARARNVLRLEFSGLYGFVFSGSPLALDVFLVDAARTTSLKDHPHKPQLRTERTNIHPDNPTKESECKVGFDKTAPCWDVPGEQITIEPVGPPPVTKIDTGHDPSKDRPGRDPVAQASVFWLPGMEQILGAGRGRINPAVFGENPTDAKVISRLHFTTGVVTSRFESPFQDVAWRIERPGSNTLQRALGELTLSIPLTSDRVRFTLRPFTGGPWRSLILRNNPDGETIVQVLNESDTACTTDQQVRNLEHFRALYEMLATPPDPSTPGPIPVCADPCPIGCVTKTSQDTYCPGTEYGP